MISDSVEDHETMKMFPALVCSGLLLAGSLCATPDHSVSVVERFFGSNETSYALIRTENDNMCSYYSSREKTWLDEYAKEDTKRENPRSTLLLDLTFTQDANHNDRYTPMPVTRTVNSKDETVAIADLLERYPVKETASWSVSDMEGISADPATGIRFRDRLPIAESGFISTVIFGGRHVEDGWRLDGVSGDMNCLYLRLSVGQDTANPETRLVCVSAMISKCVNDQRDMQEVYLVESSHGEKEDAIARAKELDELARERKYFRFHPEVWLASVNHKPTYLVVESDSKSMIDSGWVEGTESTLEIDFTPTSSERFDRKVSLSGDD